MKINNSGEIAKLIESLEECLFLGTQLQLDAAIQQFEDDPIVDDKFLHFMKRWSGWSKKVEKILADKLGHNSHYIHHFGSVGSAEFLEKKITPSTKYPSAIAKQLTALEEVIWRLEDREGLLIRQEIAKQEYDQSVKYKLNYNDSSRELTLNGMLLARPDFMSENDYFLSFIFKPGNTWRRIPLSELLKYMQKDKLGKTPSQILADLNITGNIREVFMSISSKGIEFRNPITNADSEKYKLPTINMTLSVRTSKK